MNSAPAPAATASFAAASACALDLVLETEKIAKGNTAGDGARHGPCGMLGGEDGKPHHYRLLSEGREPRVLRTKEVGIELRPGDCLEIRSSGGGGWGPPVKAIGGGAPARPRAGPDRSPGGAGVLMMFRIGVDVGGTYTDLVATDETGRTVFAKSPSTPADQSIGVMAGLEELARRLNVSRAEMLAATDRLVHGTTVATNALLERKGAKVALLTTEGHRDVIEMREGLKPDRYDLRSPPPEPLVPRELRFGVSERLKANGEVLIPLDAKSLDDAIAGIRQSGATSVAVCFLHSYLNPVHELAAVERLTQALPGISISRSSDVLPQIKEYERVSTTIVNAYVEPIVRRYLTNLEARLAEAGFKGSLFVVLSHGGMAPVEEASRLAAGTVLSGPAGGMSGGRRCADLVGIPDLVPFDMGGTSTDISLISGGQASLSADGMLAGQRIALRSLDIASIAAGGGSIASVDASRTLRVGPESAGSVPGPACYGNGGQAATVTDANVVLGYLDAAAFMGGKRPLDRAASEAAVDRIADAHGAVARGGRRRHLPHDQSEHGRRHPPDDVAPRRRSPKIRAAEFRRRGGPARGGSRARTGDQAHHRADGGLGAVGLGHADQRSPLRSQPHALRRGRAHHRRRSARAVRRAGAAGRRPAALMVQRTDGDRALRRDALRRTDL